MAPVSFPSTSLPAVQAIDQLAHLIDQLERQAGDTARIPRQEWIHILQALRQDFTHLAQPEEGPGRPGDQIAENDPAPILQVDAAGRIRYTNAAARALWKEGLVDAGQPLPEPLKEMTRQAIKDGERREIQLLLPEHAVTFCIVPLAGQNCANLYGSAMTRYKAGETFDLTEGQQTEQNSSFLANLGERLMQLDEPAAIQSFATQMLGEYLHLDRCILDEVNLEERAIWIDHDYSRGLPSLAGRFPFSSLHQQMAQAFGTGLVQVVNNTRSDPNTAPWYEPGLRNLNIHAYVAVPHHRDGAWKATLSAISNQPRQWRPEEVNLLRSAGDLIWLALEGARVLKNLKDTTRRLDIALKNAPIIVHSLDCKLRYVWVYKPPENFRIEDVLGKRYDELVPPEEVAELMELKQRVLDSGVGTRQEVHLHLKGEEQIYDVTLEPLRDAAGQVTGLTVAGINITSQRQLEAEVRERVAQIEIQRQILRHRELERLEIARDLHDGPLQDMIGLNFAISEIAMLEDPDEREAAIRHLQEMLQRQIQDVRTFCYELRPPALTPFGLERAIRSHLEHILKKNTHLQVHQNLMRDGKDLPEEIRLALYRVYQEAMNNILRHSDASQVWLTFRYDEQKIELEIADNGKGFTVPHQWVQLAREGHLGVVGMHERVEAVGGAVRIESAPGKGTRVKVTVKR